MIDLPGLLAPILRLLDKPDHSGGQLLLILGKPGWQWVGTVVVIVIWTLVLDSVLTTSISILPCLGWASLCCILTITSLQLKRKLTQDPASSPAAAPPPCPPGPVSPESSWS